MPRQRLLLRASRTVMAASKRSSVPRRPDPELADVQALAHWLDTRFVIPGTGIRFGLDFLLGLMPGVGDGITGLAGLYVIVRARALGAPVFLILRMLVNLLLDTVLGAIPVIGDLFDLTFRANSRNVRLLQRYLDTRGARR
jgi:hypothetical protein